MERSALTVSLPMPWHESSRCFGRTRQDGGLGAARVYTSRARGVE